MLLPFVIPNAVKNSARKRKRFIAGALNDKVGELRITNYKLRTPPFVIPNTVRNLAEKRKEILRFALNDKVGE